MRYDLHDALGSVIAQVSLDEDEPQVVWAAQHDAYGKKLAESSETSSPYQWGGAHGYYFDKDAGMVLMGLRWYDVETGRFVTRDPIGFGGGDSNLFRPMGNNPLNAVDPWGKNTAFEWNVMEGWRELSTYSHGFGGKDHPYGDHFHYNLSKARELFNDELLAEIHTQTVLKILGIEKKVAAQGWDNDYERAEKSGLAVLWLINYRVTVLERETVGGEKQYMTWVVIYSYETDPARFTPAEKGPHFLTPKLRNGVRVGNVPAWGAEKVWSKEEH